MENISFPEESVNESSAEYPAKVELAPTHRIVEENGVVYMEWVADSVSIVE